MNRLLIFSAFFLVLFSCSKHEDYTINQQVSAFLNDNDSTVLFGKVEVNQILNKTGFKEIPKFGNLISSVIGEFQQVIQSEEPIYFAVNGPLEVNGIPETVYGFLAIKNADSLVEVLTKKGYDFDKKDDLYLSQFDDVTVGIKNKTAIIVSKKGDYDGEGYILSAFDKITKDESKGVVKEILNAKGDIVIGYGIENAYISSSAKMEGLTEGLKAEVKEMVKDSYGLLSLHFEKGEARMVSKNYFSPKLKEQLFFNKDENGSIVKRLGEGNARIGLSMNVDMVKLQKFLNKYSPGFIDQVASLVGGPAQMALMMGGDDPLSGLLSGELGFVMFGEPDKNGATVPSFNAYVGFGKQGKSLAQMASSFLNRDDLKTIINEKGVSCFTSVENEPNGGKLKLPIGCQSFGKKAFTGFVNVEGMDMTSFNLSNEYKVLELVKYISFEFDEDGGEIIVKAKDPNVNVLKQAVDFYLNEFADQIGAMSL